MSDNVLRTHEMTHRFIIESRPFRYDVRPQSIWFACLFKKEQAIEDNYNNRILAAGSN